MSNTALILSIAVAVLATFLTRALPFWFLRKHQEHPLVSYLGKLLPPVLMVVLVIYAIKTPLSSGSLPINELASLALVTVLHLLFKNTLLSIVLGTALYIFLIN